jgi:hypothetical protein
MAESAKRLPTPLVVLCRLVRILILCGAFVLLLMQGAMAAASQSAPNCQALVQQLKSVDRDARADAVEELRALGPRAACAVDALRAALNDDEWVGVGVPAMKALGRIGPAALAAFPDILAKAVDRDLPSHAAFDPGDITEAFVGLGPGVIPMLAPFLDAARDDGGAVAPGLWDFASAVLARFGAQSVPVLIRALSHQPSALAAADAIERIGEPAAAAVPALITAYDFPDNDNWDRWEIGNAMLAMGAKGCAGRAVVDRLVQEVGESKAVYLDGLTAFRRSCSARP